MNYQDAIRKLKEGAKMRRAAWRQSNIWLTYCTGQIVLAADHTLGIHLRQHAEQNGGTADVLPFIAQKTAKGRILYGWCATRPDMQADDWEVADEGA